MKNVDKKTILLALLAVISIMINILLLINKILIPNIKQKDLLTKEEIVILSEEEQKIQETDYIKTLSEGKRITRYVANYIKYIEVKQYQKAYDLLNQDFKENYFDTIEKYKEYVTEHYAENIGIYYSDISRQGNYYILSATVIDIKREKAQIEQRFIVYEQDFNDYELSFEVVE